MDLIKREDAIKVTWQEPSYTDAINALTEVRERIKGIPSAEPKQGEWIIREVKFGIYKYQCKDCGWYEYHAYGDVKPHNFCPNCGARMVK